MMDIDADAAELYLNQHRENLFVAKVFDKPYFSVKLLFPFSLEKARHLPLDIGEIRYNAAQNILSYSKAMVE